MSNKIGIMDLLTFAKAGYTPKDVKEIMAMADSSEEVAEVAPRESEKPEPQKEPEKAESSEPDYKSMFEEMQKKNEELSSKLKEAQSANIAKDASGSAPKISAQDAVNNIFKDVIY